ncbi:MAG: PSD1 and planctomycete cytochrome C domain-containing protein [Pirellulaceae bacterium]|nr:PSD1 and planctomycete cytochrome C domain-containing protein [Pirellulaceae bacterium]
MSSIRLECVVIAIVGRFLLISSLFAEAATPVFERDVLPIFELRCSKCHGDKVQKGDLDLSSIGGVRRGGESGEALIANSLVESYLWKMVERGEMPPEGQSRLTDKELVSLRSWIESGGNSISLEEVSDGTLTQHDVLPILLLRCVACHGATLKRGDVDLRSLAAMRQGGKNGPVLVSGDPNASLMIQRIESEACPPRELLLKFFVKRPSATELAKLRDWIDDGALAGDVEPDVATTEPDRLVTDEDRKHWAFQPLMDFDDTRSLDDFVLQKLNENGLEFSLEASRDTLIRRAYLDLVGMPPDLEEWKHWHENASTDWYSQMIESLLASPHYGERWGRYWLDVAGYSDSEGGVSADPIREVAWKYRDYVVRAFNKDKPYDRFLLEQMAGDELLDYENASVVTEPMVENLVATGFLRMGIDQTGSRTMNYVPERLGVIGDAIAVVGSGVMGLTLECAKCHSHKYDAIPHRDYYRFKAIFQGALDEHDWLSFKNRVLSIDTPERRQRVAEVNPPLAAAMKRLEVQLRKSIVTLQLETLRQHYPLQTESQHQETVAALKIADNNRSLQQRILVEKLQRAELIPDSEQQSSVAIAREEVQSLEREFAAIRRKMEPSLSIRALWDRGDPSPTYLLRRGEHDRAGPLVGPGVPSVLTDGQTPFEFEPPFPHGTAKTGRRLAFARWLTQANHPLTSRVMVNRVWYHHFGSGLVRSIENFGVKGELPSHPELLDWLAVQFLQHNWSVKELHRVVMNSQTYRQSSQITPEVVEHDPQNILWSRMPLRRMDAESLYDSLLQVSGGLDDRFFGPPDSVTVDRDGMVSVDPTTKEKWRRSIYAQYRRTETPTMMDTFDYPEMGPNCVVRSVSIVSPQSLMMMNNDHVYNLARLLAKRVEAISSKAASNPSSDDKLASQVELVYELTLSRQPSDKERQTSIASLRELYRLCEGEHQAPLVTFCHTVLNSASFMYID